MSQQGKMCTIYLPNSNLKLVILKLLIKVFTIMETSSKIGNSLIIIVITKRLSENTKLRTCRKLTTL